MIATGISAFINFCVIELSGVIFQVSSNKLSLISLNVIDTFFYLSGQMIARAITNWEHPRTQADYENSYTFKMFLFQFINYYCSLIYTAFFKVRKIVTF